MNKSPILYAALVLLGLALACDRGGGSATAPAVSSTSAASKLHAPSARANPSLSAEERAEHDPEREDGSEGVAVGKIYELQAAFHRAKTTQDLDLMMSLWDDDGTLNVVGNPSSPFVGAQQLRSFWQTSGSFTHRRFSLVPSFKTQIVVHGDEAFLYFECHDVGDYDLATRAIVVDTYLAGTVRKVDGKWVFSNMTAGTAFPLSVDHFFFP